MPRKPADTGHGDPTASMDKAQRKSERSHEENQERAYIAASRRADRSIEARVQSARMASEIHKKRTGKAFRITEEIVIKEEMYEEDDDDLPRSYRLLGSHMQTDSGELSSRLEAYLQNRVTMTAMVAATTSEVWRENEVNRQFDLSFPNASQQAQQLSQHMSGAMYHVQPQSPPVDNRPVFQSVSYIPRSRHRDQARSRSAVSPSGAASPYGAAHTPGSNPDTPAARATPSFDSAMGPDTPLHFGPGASAFTAELPPEAKLLMGGTPMDGSYGQVMYTQPWVGPSQYHDPSEIPRAVKMEEPTHEAMMADYYSHDPTAPMKWDASSNVMEESWDTFINDAAWGNDQQ